MDFSLLKSLVDKFSFFNGNTINSHNGEKQFHVHIHLPEGEHISPELVAEARNALKNIFTTQKEGFLAATSQSQKDLQLIYEYHKEDGDKALRHFICDNLPAKDVSIWLSALILREQFAKGNKEIVTELKNEMIYANGERGCNIANLCSAQYLESHIIPLYEYLVKDKGEKGLFLEIYETVITEYPFAVFVSRDKKPDELFKEIETKINLVQTYGWKKVSVHGIGEYNVKNIMDVLSKIDSKQFKIKSLDYSSFESEGMVIKVDINLD